MANGMQALDRSLHVLLVELSEHDGMASDSKVVSLDNSNDSWHLLAVVLLAKCLQLGALYRCQERNDQTEWACHLANLCPD